MSNSVRPHRRQPTWLHHPWDSPGKNTGVGCHFLLLGMKVKSGRSRSVVSDSSDPMDCSLPGSSVHGIFQARVLEWGAIAFSGYKLNKYKNPSSPWGNGVGMSCFHFSVIIEKYYLKYPLRYLLVCTYRKFSTGNI